MIDVKFPKSVTFPVLADDISEGRRRDCRYCPLALAVLHRMLSARPALQFAGSTDDRRLEVAVTSDITFYETWREQADGGMTRRCMQLAVYDHSDASSAFITAFDKNKPVSPCRLTLKLDSACRSPVQRPCA